MSRSVSARVALSIEAGGELSQSLTKQIYNEIRRQGIPKFSVSGWFTVGPPIVLAAEGEISIRAQAQLLAGVQMEIRNFSANLDLIDKQKLVSTGFSPNYTRIFNASGEISAKVAIGIPLGIAFGIQISALPDPSKEGETFDKSVSVTTKPSIEASTSFTPSGNGCPINGNTCVNGLENELNFLNRIYANIFDYVIYELNMTQKPIAGGCVRFGVQPQCPAAGSRRRGLPVRSHAESAQGLAERQAQNETFPQLFPNNITAPMTDITEYEAVKLAFTLDATYSYIIDLSGNNELFGDPQCNLLFADPGKGSLFAIESGFVKGDAANRFFHYYTDTIKAYSISRLRLSDEEHIPVTSDFLTLGPLNYDANSKTPDAYVAVDTVGGVCFLVTCDIQDQPSKVFLVADVTTGIPNLQDPNLRYTVTGGRVERCYVLPLAAPPGSFDSAITPAFNSATESSSATAVAAPSRRA